MTAVGAAATHTTVVRVDRPLDLRATLIALRRGVNDRCTTFVEGSCWRAFHTPLGPATVHLASAARGTEVHARAWGPGAEWAIASAPDLVGARDSLDGWAPRHPLVRELFRRKPGLRVPRSGLVFDTLLPTVLEQKVTGTEARWSYAQLVGRFGSTAPGPMSLRVPPPAPVVAALPSWEWHRAGVDHTRARTAATAAAVAPRLEEATSMALADAERRLRGVRGVGAWTVAEVAQRALGDADAVSVGDFHLSDFVGWALCGHRVDDAEMLALLEQFRPHRYRAIRLLELSGLRHPRYGPRMPVVDRRSI